MLAGFVPQNRQPATVVPYLVETEVIPGPRRQQWVHFDYLIGARAQSYQSGDHEIAEGRMVVIFAALLSAFARIPRAVFPALQPGSRQPVTVGGVEVLIDPWDDPTVIALEVMRLGINLQRFEV